MYLKHGTCGVLTPFLTPVEFLESGWGQVSLLPSRASHQSLLIRILHRVYAVVGEELETKGMQNTSGLKVLIGSA